MNEELNALQQKLEMHNRELAEAHSHIAVLEEKLLELKQYRRELKLLREQKNALRKSPERRLGQTLLAPYRLSEKLAKKIFPREKRSRGPRALTDYQKWFERHHTSAHDLERMRGEARRFGLWPLISIIPAGFRHARVARLHSVCEAQMA